MVSIYFSHRELTDSCSRSCHGQYIALLDLSSCGTAAMLCLSSGEANSGFPADIFSRKRASLLERAKAE